MDGILFKPELIKQIVAGEKDGNSAVSWLKRD
jgi:hypothetical protein